MPFDFEWKGDQIPDELDEPFYQANELLGRAFTRNITRRHWGWPTAPTPRDIVDLGQLRDSYVAERGRAGDDPLVDHAWTARHSLPVHQGAVIKNAFGKGITVTIPARPWTKKPLDDDVLAKAFEALVNAGVK